MIMDLTYGLGEEIYGMSEVSASIIPRDEVHILVTEALTFRLQIWGL